MARVLRQGSLRRLHGVALPWPLPKSPPGKAGCKASLARSRRSSRVVPHLFCRRLAILFPELIPRLPAGSHRLPQHICEVFCSIRVSYLGRACSSFPERVLLARPSRRLLAASSGLLRSIFVAVRSIHVCLRGEVCPPLAFSHLLPGGDQGLLEYVFEGILCIQLGQQRDVCGP